MALHDKSYPSMPVFDNVHSGILSMKYAKVVVTFMFRCTLLDVQFGIERFVYKVCG